MAGAAQQHIAVGILGIVNPQQVHRARSPVLFSLGHHGLQRRQFSRLLGGPQADATECFAEESAFGADTALHLLAVGVLRRIRVVDGERDNQPGQGDQQVERQQRHAGDVMHIQGAAAKGAVQAQGEKLAEQLAMDDHAGHQQAEHGHAGNAHQPGADVFVAQRQVVVEGVDKATGTQGQRLGQRLKSDRVEQVAAALARLFAAVSEGQERCAFQGQDDGPDRRIGGALFQQWANVTVQRRPLHAVIPVQARAGHHPAVDFLVEHRQAAGPEYGEQQDAEHHAGPGVQLAHAASESCFHACPCSSRGVPQASKLRPPSNSQALRRRSREKPQSSNTSR